MHLEFSGLYFIHYVSKKEITQAIKQATLSIIFSASASVLWISVDADDYFRLLMRQCFQHGC